MNLALRNLMIGAMGVVLAISGVARTQEESDERGRPELDEAGGRIENLERELKNAERDRDQLQGRLEVLDQALQLIEALEEMGERELPEPADIPSVATELPPTEKIRFNRDVRPILSENCYQCHGPDEEQRKAGLRLDDEQIAFSEIESGVRAIVPGDLEASELIRRIMTDDRIDVMPSPKSGKELTEDQKRILRTWVEQGAEWEKHWAFIKPERAAPREVTDQDWARNPIDTFIAARLEAAGLRPSAEADRRTLIRRVSLDLVGLPPTPEEVEAFAADVHPQAYENLVDGLLGSSHYGERWARHWLDAARYADSNGYSVDESRSMWKWRDWVISAFNSGMPFDQFVVEQFAGDLLPEPSEQQKIATGFQRNTMINQEGGIDKEEFRIEAVIDRVNTLGTVFLGLTLECARCHSHKFDPITQTEYFALFAFLNEDDEKTLALPTPELLAARKQSRREAGVARLEISRYLIEAETGAQAEWEAALAQEDLAELKPEEREALATGIDVRTEAQDKLVVELFKKADREYRRRAGELRGIERKAPRIPTSMVLARQAEPRTTNLFLQGDFTRLGDAVSPGVPAALHPMPETEKPTRLDLARWLVDPENPLLARVTVNRFWQRFFGKGIVETENDFGAQGAPPTHPELLDWLATEFVARDWSVRAIHRLIVTSAAYRQASVARPELAAADPENKLLGRQNRLRLDAEIVRDSALVASGLLNPELGGPSVFPPQPSGVMKLGQQSRAWNVSSGADRYRRGLYTFFWRATPYPALTVFDAPNSMKACTRRARSNTPLQALTLLNEAAFVEFAEALARRLMDGDKDDGARLDRAYELCLGRGPNERERDIMIGLLADERAAGGEDGEGKVWTAVARVMMNLDEFVTRE